MHRENAFEKNIVYLALLPCLDHYATKNQSESKTMGVILVACITIHQAVGDNFAQQTVHICLLTNMPNTFPCSDELL